MSAVNQNAVYAPHPTVQPYKRVEIGRILTVGSSMAMVSLSAVWPVWIFWVKLQPIQRLEKRASIGA